MSGDISGYLAKITSEHKNKPKFAAFVSVFLQPLADIIAVANSMPGLFDIDTAVGQQLDFLGEWIGLTRFVNVPVVGTYFSFDITGLGFDEGTWFSSGDPFFTTTALDDPTYRNLLKAKILQNQWDGSMDGAYAIWDQLFEGTGLVVAINDHADLTFDMSMVATIALPTPVQIALFTGGYISTRPAGIRIRGYTLPTIVAAKIFSLDLEDNGHGGLDESIWLSGAGFKFFAWDLENSMFGGFDESVWET